MSPLDAIAGTARPGTLYGIGVGPGDIRYLTLRACGLIRSVDVLASFAKRDRESRSRAIVAPLIRPGQVELALPYPVTTEMPVAHPDYVRQIATFYARAADDIAARLGNGKSVGVLSEGDPFFYGSFMHLWRRLSARFPVEIVPGVTGMSGSWSRAGAPITWGDDILSVLPATLEESVLARRLADTDAAVVMKLGANLAKVRRALRTAGVVDRAILVEHATMPGERVTRLVECRLEVAPYFAVVLVPGRGRCL